MRPLGADVSFHQRRVDWRAAWEAGLLFAYIRWGQRRDWFDSRGPSNWRASGETPILRGAYWVWDQREGHRADDHIQGVLDAAQEIGLWERGYDGELRFAADLELEPVEWEQLHRWLRWLEDWTGRRPLIYTGSWFYQRVAPLPDWLREYDHWLTGYNQEGPDIWGPLADLDPRVVVWQQSPAWAVEWTESGTADRDYWLGTHAQLLEEANMAEKVVRVADLAKWIQANAFDAEPVDGPEISFRLTWPVPPPVVVTQPYGVNPQFYPGQKGHEGIDIRAANGVPVSAAAPGRVYRVESNPDSGAYGIHVRVEHDHPEGTFKTIYAHLNQVHVAVGNAVITGEILGLADNTGRSSGPHLHITLKKVGEGSTWLNMGDIVNPTPYFLELFPGRGWLVDVPGNLRTRPKVEDNTFIRLAKAGETFQATGLFSADWWELHIGGGRTAWLWNPGYKLRAI